jgi:predicted nucleic acid-binding protein
MPRRSVLVDTSFVLAMDNKGDPHHGRAVDLARQLKGELAELVVPWGVLLELGDGYARVGRRARGVQIIEVILTRAEYRVVPLDQELVDAALGLYVDRPDKDWGLTDCVSFEVMRREGIAEALTADAHFRQAGFVALLLES